MMKRTNQKVFFVCGFLAFLSLLCTDQTWASYYYTFPSTLTICDEAVPLWERKDPGANGPGIHAQCL